MAHHVDLTGNTNARASRTCPGTAGMVTLSGTAADIKDTDPSWPVSARFGPEWAPGTTADTGRLHPHSARRVKPTTADPAHRHSAPEPPQGVIARPALYQLV